jgi:hypothetical protein
MDKNLLMDLEKVCEEPREQNSWGFRVNRDESQSLRKRKLWFKIIKFNLKENVVYAESMAMGWVFARKKIE